MFEVFMGKERLSWIFIWPSSISHEFIARKIVSRLHR